MVKAKVCDGFRPPLFRLFILSLSKDDGGAYLPDFSAIG
jgi:hypothetical protein